MKGMFNECTSLISLSDISNWNTKNPTDMREMFNNCFFLISLPNIYKWAKNITNFDNMFNN